MARLALTAIGFLAGGPVGAMIGGVVGGLFEEMMADESVITEGPRLKDLHIQTSSYARPIPKIYGTVRLAGNVIWASPAINPPQIAQIIQGDLIGSEQGSFAVAICAGPISKILRIWANGELIYDNRAANTGAVKMDNLSITTYLGTETQTADSVMEAWQGAGNVPAHRGLAYVVFNQFPIEAFYNRVPNFEFEISTDVALDLSYEIITDVTAATTDKDNIVFYPDGLHFVITSDDWWFKVNTLTNDLILSVEHADPEIPLNTGGFDIDENSIIHTCKEGGSGFAKLCQLDGDTFAEIDAGTTQINYASVIRVSRNTDYPYVAAIPLNGGVGETLHITHRYNYTFGGGVNEITLNPPTGTEWGGIDFDDNTGIIWAVAKGTASSITKVVKIAVFSNGSYTQQVWSISEIEKADYITYDADTDLIILGSASQDRLASYDAADMSYQNLKTFTNVTWNMKSAFRRGAVDGFLYFVLVSDILGTHTAYKVNITTLVVADSWEFDESGVCNCGSADTGGSAYDPIAHSMVMACYVDSSADYLRFYLNRGAASDVLLSSIVEDICDSAGIDNSEEVNASDLTDLVHGYAVTDRMTARAALMPLMMAYFFNCVDTDGALQFIKRGNAAILNIPQDDLGAHIGGGEAPQRLTSIRQQELELPRAIEVAYIDKDANYCIGAQRASRQIALSQEMRTIRLPIVLSHDDAKQIAHSHLMSIWIERMRHQTTVHRGYTYLDAGDVITITEDGTIHTVRLERIGYGGGIISLDLVNESAEAFVSDATGIELPTDDPDVNYPGTTLLVLIDCTLISTANNKPGLYVATMGYTPTWTGASIFRNDTGIWQALEKSWLTHTIDAVIGKATTVLADVTDPWVWDEGNTITVRLLDSVDTLSNATELEVLNGANLAVLGDEIIQWKTATLNTDGTYTLSGLLRGRKGSEWATGTHAVGDYLIVLLSTNVTFVELSIDYLNEVQWYRAASFGMHISSGSTQIFTAAFRNMMPWSPQEIAGTRDGSNNLTITWTRRTRIGGEWADGGDVSLGETAESYSLDVYDGSVVVRTIAVTAETASYTAAQQVTDFGSTQAAIDIIVYQISSVVGRGFGTEATV